MRLGAIILKLRWEETSFDNFIGGAAELQEILANIQRGTLTRDQAFVIPADEEGEDNDYESDINQAIIERFSVICIIKNDNRRSDPYGIIAYEKLHNIRLELMNSLLRWEPPDAEGFITYRRGKLIDLNPAYLWYAYDFSYSTRLVGKEVTEIARDPHTELIYEISIAMGKMKSGQKVDDKFTGKTLDELLALIPDPEAPVDFNTIYANMVESPSADLPHLGDLPLQDGFPNVTIPDIAQFIDMTKHPGDGAFAPGFGTGYKLKTTLEGE